MEKILIELILTNNCNKRCEYCDLDFNNKSLSFQDLDLFIIFLKDNKAEYSINFFWWEPLLAYDKIKYFLEKSKWLVSSVSIWTNWLLLDREKLEYFKKNNVRIHLSVDNINLWKWVDLQLISNYQEKLIINFINDPDYLLNSEKCYKKIISFWFKTIAFMPVFSTKQWNKETLIEFKKIYNYILNNKSDINIDSYSYFNWISLEKQFILDTDLFFYSDLDSLLWLQKQYKNINPDLKIKINQMTKLQSLNSPDISLKKLINLYNIDDIVKLVFEIPKRSWDFINYKIIDKLLLNGK